MSMIASDNGGQTIEKLENGVYTAVSSAMIDLGLQRNEQFGKTQRKFMMIWTIIGEDVEINGEKQPRTISKEYSFSLNEKSTLRKDLQAWRGVPFKEDELKGFDLTTILNKACQLQIILEEKNNKKYNNIAGIMSLPKGMKVEGLDNTYYFDMTNAETWENYCRIPNWIQEKIKKAENLESTNFDRYIKEYDEIMKEQEGKQEESNTNSDTEIIAPDDDLPF